MPLSNLVKVVLAVVVIALAAFLLLGHDTSANTISASQSTRLSINSTYNFKLPDNSTSTLFLAKSSSNGSTFYLMQGSSLLNPVKVITLSKGQTANVSVSGDGNADLQISLTGSETGKANVTLTYIMSTLGIRQSSGISYMNSSLQNTQSSSGTQSALQQPNTTSSLATTQSTTISAPKNMTLYALELANGSDFGTILNTYKSLFQREATQCTASAYDSEYVQLNGQVPVVPNDFANATTEAPTNLVSSVTNVGTDLYNVTYSTVAKVGNSTAGVIEVNTNTGKVVTTNLEGPIFGGLTYSDMVSQYVQLNTTGVCSIYVP